MCVLVCLCVCVATRTILFSQFFSLTCIYVGIYVWLRSVDELVRLRETKETNEKKVGAQLNTMMMLKPIADRSKGQQRLSCCSSVAVGDRDLE